VNTGINSCLFNDRPVAVVPKWLEYRRFIERQRIGHDLRHDDFNVRIQVPRQSSGAPQRVQRFLDTSEEDKDRDS
jgi:hypothetical protein